MANYCDNVVYISTTDKDKLLSLITRIIQNGHEYCDTILPAPQNLSNKDSDAWYGEHRGCNSSVTLYDGQLDEPFIEEDDGVYTLRLRYDSKWSPNLGVSNKLTKDGFSVIHKYWEPGVGVCGVFNTDVNGYFSQEWEAEDCGFDSMVRIDEDQINDHEYISFSPEELKAMKFREIGEFLIIDDKPIGVWSSDEMLLLSSSGEFVDAPSWELKGRTYFSRYTELAEECGWEEE